MSEPRALESDIEDLATTRALIATLQEQLATSQREVASLRHQLDVLCQRLFGKKSERVDRSARVIEVLARLDSVHGAPRVLRSDNVLPARVKGIRKTQLLYSDRGGHSGQRAHRDRQGSATHWM